MPDAADDRVEVLVGDEEGVMLFRDRRGLVMKSRLTPFAVRTTRNGPEGSGGGRSKVSTKKRAAASRSAEWTMV